MGNVHKIQNIKCNINCTYIGKFIEGEILCNTYSESRGFRGFESLRRKEKALGDALSFPRVYAEC